MELDKLDLYAELGVAENASDREIVVAYRKKALKYHPDKNPLELAKQKFQHLTAVYAVLSDLKLREQYELLRKRTQIKENGLSDEVKRFRDQLRRAEKQHARMYEDAGLREQKIQLLQKEAQDLRYQFERERSVDKFGYVSYKDLDFSGRFTTLAFNKEEDREVEVKWKLREEPEAQIDASTLSEIMAVFGAVESAKIGETRNGYVYGCVVYELCDGAEAAAAHDYKQRARRWENTKVRKLASLLRGCKRERRAEPLSSYAALVLEQLTGQVM